MILHSYSIFPTTKIKIKIKETTAYLNEGQLIVIKINHNSPNSIVRNSLVWPTAKNNELIIVIIISKNTRN